MVHPIARKFGPTAAMFVLTAWCGWQYLEDASPFQDMAHGARAKINTDDLSPELPPASHRDMFSVGGVAARMEAAAKQAAHAPPPYDPTGLLKGLKLKGTFIHGAKRFAVINESVFDVGQTVASDDNAGKRCHLISVTPDAAVVGIDGQRFRLSYGGTAPAAIATQSRMSRRAASQASRPPRKGVGFSLMRALTNSMATATPNSDAMRSQIKSLGAAVKPIGR